MGIRFWEVLGAVALFCFVGLANANTVSNIVNATLTVACPFSVTTNALPLYIRTGNIILNYTLFTQSSCTISNLQGNFALSYQSNGTVFVFNSITMPSVTQTANTYNTIPINTLTLPVGFYIAKTSFSQVPVSNSSSATFDLLNPANIMLVSLSASSVNLNSPITFSVVLKNDGGLASNSIPINLLVTGPVDFNMSFTANALSPSQSETVLITLGNITGVAGSYKANVFATYLSNNLAKQSNQLNVTYTVSTPVSSGSGGLPGTPPATRITAVPGIAFTAIPLFTSLLSGSEALTELGVKNIGSSSEFINASVATPFLKLLSLSATSILLNPNSGVAVQFLFNPNSSGQPGMYIVPVNVSSSLPNNGGQSRQTEYFEFDVMNKTGFAAILNQIMLKGRDLDITMQIDSPDGTGISNATVITQLPRIVAQNLSQISTYGLPSNVSITPSGNYRIKWYISYLAPKQSTYAYYRISNASSTDVSTHIQNVMIQPSRVNQSNVLKIINIGIPTFYTDSSENITVEALYTGIAGQSVVFSLTAPPAMGVENATQTVNATPNLLMIQNFSVSTGGTPGTYLLSLYVFTNQGNETFTLPVVVLHPQSLGITTIPQRRQNPRQGFGFSAFVSALSSNRLLLLVILSIAGVIIIGILASKANGMSRYNRGRAEQLIRIRQQVERDGE